MAEDGTQTQDDMLAERDKAITLRNKAFGLALKVPKGQRLPKPDSVTRMFGGLFQNCGAYFTQASTWYEAASDAYDRGQAALGASYMKKGDAAFDAGEDCMSWW